MPRPKPLQEGKTLDRIPTTIGEWSLLEKYPMSDAALNELKPDEYVARIYVNAAGEQADLSIIAGSHTGAFHNPQVCFRVQNWEFSENEGITLNVPEREPIQARFVRLISLDGQRREAVGVYFYSTPMGYRDDTSSARIFLLLARLTGMNQQRAYFVRFLKTATGDPSATANRLSGSPSRCLPQCATRTPKWCGSDDDRARRAAGSGHRVGKARQRAYRADALYD
jgi:EpsI family protein